LICEMNPNDPMRLFLKGKKMTSFSAEEDKQTGVDCTIITETTLTQRGAIYSRGPVWESYVVDDEGLVVGQARKAATGGFA